MPGKQDFHSDHSRRLIDENQRQAPKKEEEHETPKNYQVPNNLGVGHVEYRQLKINVLDQLNIALNRSTGGNLMHAKILLIKYFNLIREDLDFQEKIIGIVKKHNPEFSSDLIEWVNGSRRES